MTPWVIVFHLTGVVLWVSGLLATALVMVQHTKEGQAPAREALARLERKFLRRIADPGAGLTILAGITMLAHNSYFLHAQWLYLKLFFVGLLIVLHGLISVRAKRLSAGDSRMTTREASLLAAAVVVVLLLILMATLPGSVYFT